MSTRKRTQEMAALKDELHEKPAAQAGHSSVKHGHHNELSEYERSRIENIQKNEEFLASLGLDSVIESLKPSVAKKPTKKGVTRGEAAKRVVLPTRRSGRVTTEKLKSEVEELIASGKTDESIAKQEELNAMLAKQKEGSYEVEAFGAAAASDSYYDRAVQLEPISLVTQMDNKASEEDRSGENIVTILREIDSSCAAVPATETIKKETQETTNKQQAKAKGAVAIKANKSDKAQDKKVSASSATTSDSDHYSSGEEYLTRLNKLSLAEGDVAKLTSSRITSVYIHPSEHKTIVMAGDKNGTFGIWDLDHGTARSSDQTTESSNSTEGIYKYSPHVSNIGSIYSHPEESSSVYTVSYDSTIKRIDLQTGAFSLAFQHPVSDDDIRFFYYTDATFSKSNKNLCTVARSDGMVSLIDFRASASTYQYTAIVQENIKINSVQLHPTAEHLVITAGAARGAITIHDNRVLPARSNNNSNSSGSSVKVWGAVSTIDVHKKSINAAYCSPDGQYLVSVSQDDTVKVMRNFVASSATTDSAAHSITNKSAKGSKTSSTSSTSSNSSNSGNNELKVHTIRHNNNTGRWLSTFRPAFDHKQPHTFVLGSMEQPRRVGIFSPLCSSGAGDSSSDFSVPIVATLQDSEHLNSVCSRNYFHPTLDIIACGNSSGRVHVFR